MDDIWDEDATTPSELKRVEREHGNAGYLDGITQTKALGHQPGFDEGYREGAEIGLRAGRIIGRFQAQGLHDLELNASEALKPQNLFSIQFYTADAQPMFAGSDHPVILEWEQRADLLAPMPE